MPSRPVPSVGDRHPAMVPDRPLAVRDHPLASPGPCGTVAGVPTRPVGA
jgi:hypothetical protein